MIGRKIIIRKISQIYTIIQYEKKQNKKKNRQRILKFYKGIEL